MALFPGHEAYSVSAEREGCAEVRDVHVSPAARRAGVATALMRALEAGAEVAGFDRVGLTVATGGDAVAARGLYERLGYRRSHGPFVTSATLASDDGPIPVCAVVDYLVKELRPRLADARGTTARSGSS